MREVYWKSLSALSGVSAALDRRLKPFYCPLQQLRNRGLYAVELDSWSGFFAQLNKCLRIFAYCEKKELKPVVRLTSLNYAANKGESWLDYFFEHRQLDPDDRKFIDAKSPIYSRVSEVDQLGLGLSKTGFGGMTLEDANRLFSSVLGIRKEITEYVDNFHADTLSGRNVLGVHFRGTDKKLEAKPVTPEFVAATVSRYIEANPAVDALFVASDEEYFVTWLAERFRDIKVVAHPDTVRSSNHQAVHVQRSIGDKFLKGKEALVNSLLLAKCSALVRTSSFLSGWSSIFNPSLPIVMVNSPYEEASWFPDALLKKKSLDKYLPAGD